MRGFARSSFAPARRLHWPLVPALIIWLAGVGGCSSGDHSVFASEFQRGCSVASDCVPIYEGALGCCGGACPNAAINQASYAAYESAVAKRTPKCSPEPPCVFIPDDVCMAGAICAGGTCAFVQLGADAASPD